MSELLAKHIGSKRAKKRERQIEDLPLEEQKALAKMQKLAEEAGAVLTFDGVGGLPPSLVLGVIRRDKFTCKIHGDKGEGKYGGIQVHHKGGIIESEWLSKKGHSNDPNNIVTLCARAHDELHNRARAEGVDSSQVTPEGDET